MIKSFKKTILLTILLLNFMITNSNSKQINSFYDLEINSIDGKLISFAEFKNKAVLIVNVASYCGFTKQYSDMQKLWENYKSLGLIVLGIPSNSFNQEKSNEKDVKEFCNVNFNINFPMTSIYEVKGENAHELYNWAKREHGRSAVPKWNFHKILIDKNGKIVDTFASFTNPQSKKIINKIDEILN